MSLSYFSELLPVLAERSKLGAISRLGFANAPLRRHLAEMFDSPYGEPGAFLADPTFEAVFGWHNAEPSMADLAGSLLDPLLTQAMDEPPAELAKEYRFAREQHPYRHQLEAWRILAQTPAQSLIVASGTGSGKTECFMVPILDRLVRLRAEQQGRLIGMRALFLYPLNALINSQRERLRAWTHAFGGDIRFCLYNGNTPEKLPTHVVHAHPNEVPDRENLRATPPPILVTNATMLEYMLVRTADAPILIQSQGKLEWVVLDEAHTYVGSQAAETALLIRRVLFAFGVTPEQVRFVATSATIGDPEGDAGQKLKRFLADVAGVSPERVHLVTGQRRIPALDGITPKHSIALQELTGIDKAQETSPRRYDALTENKAARKLRDLFIGDRNRPPVARLSEVCAALFGAGNCYSVNQQHKALRWLDLLSGTRDKTGAVFLPLRAHLFHQTLSGLWACADPYCPQKKGTALEDKEWPFGQIYLEPCKHCDCGAPVYEVIACGDCGTVHLLAGEHKGRLAHLQPQAALDEFELEVEPGEDQSEDENDARDDDRAAAGRQNKVLIVNRELDHVAPLDIDRPSRQIAEPSDNTLRVFAHEDGGNGLLCPACGGQETPKERLFQFSRLGAPFLLGSILPTLLEFAPDSDKPAEHPCRGRRLLTFNDSRQGTARMAAKLQQDAERNRVRGLVYHLTLQHGREKASQEAKKLKDEIQKLEELIPSDRQRDPRFVELLSPKRSRLEELTRPVPIPFNELAQQLANQRRDFDNMLAHYRRLAPNTFIEASGPVELARMFLVREFGRRPKRLNNLESMGLVAVRYPALENIPEPPANVQAAGFDRPAWLDFLKLCLDFYVRAGGSLAVSLPWRNWLGMPFPQSKLVARDEAHVGRNQRRWPRAKRSGLRSTPVRLLAHALKANITTADGEDRVDAVLLAAWDTLTSTGPLQRTADEWDLPLDSLAFAPMSQAWICPVTRRFLDTTLRSVSPYLPKQATDATALCQKVKIPLYDEPFGGVTNDLERIRRGREWLAHADITFLRDQGLWSVLNDRVIELTPYFAAAEHSAQQESETLNRYEKEFKAGDLNLLSCSTTMEMGIDIGGISQVAMNNVPPHPANYLQRAGRAGRRQEARSLAMTLCKSNPHDQSVFVNSRWAFDSALPAPRVALDSAIIVQRHVHSLLLSRFLAETLIGCKQEQTRLTCGFFFLNENSLADPLADRFAAWCRSFSADRSQELAKGLRQLLRHSVYDGNDLNRVMDIAAREIDGLAQGWRAEWENLEREIDEVKVAGKTSPAFRAVMLHQKRLSGEYLLRELATRGYLPAYGFPTHIASFDNLTAGQFLRRKQQVDGGREDNRYRRRELANRDLTTALREYAPGSEVVMDGLVYRSAGVTLNWHIPADQQDAPREIQNIRVAWRCNHCGASGSSHNLETARHCNDCGAEIVPAHIQEFLEPAGFAVDFSKDPSNDISTQHFVPVEAPWIDARGDWFPLPNPALGRFRVSTQGHVFHQSRGIHGKGYALCLECGRAEPMPSDGTLPDVFQKPHRKLRRTKEEGSFCKGSDNAWKVKQGITLGHESWTDVLEIQLKTENGNWLNDATVATTLAVALRDALAELIGVQTIELGCGIKLMQPETGLHCQSIIIFDRFAAGYASSAERYLDRLFHDARKRLECPADCDSACPHCVLDFDQRFVEDNLDRRSALDVLTDRWLNSLCLPDEYAYFGTESRPEYHNLPEAIWRAVAQQNAGKVRFYTGGTPEAWDIGPSPLRELAYRFAGQGVDVEIIVPSQMVAALNDSDRFLLASLVDHPKVTVRVIAVSLQCGRGWLVAETLSHPASRWALDTEAALAFGLDWGKSEGPLITTRNGTPSPLTEDALAAETIRPQRIDSGDREIEIHHELDGSLQGFGLRFWQYVSSQHPATRDIFADTNSDLVSLTYRDRYLFTPLSVALLAEVVCGLRQVVGRERWGGHNLFVITTSRRSAGENASRNKIWSDWPEMNIRDQVLEATLHYQGIDASIQQADTAITGHGRLLEVEWSSGKKLTVRFDQGVSYWRAHSNNRYACHFDLSAGNADMRGKQLAELAVDIEGANLPTQLFVKDSLHNRIFRYGLICMRREMRADIGNWGARGRISGGFPF
ncbi:MAG: DEAD/DEAH box helicase, partial [Azoarcus sp.]|nr:DEAD/DEAH box helicase [Azoarcus sp.]